MLHKLSTVQKLSNKQSAKVICRLIDLEQHTARDKQAITALETYNAGNLQNNAIQPPVIKCDWIYENRPYWHKK